MAGNIGPPPAECPSCAAGGISSSVKLYQINLEQAAVFCENAFCAFPLFSQDVCPLVVQQAAVPTPTANLKLKTRSMDTESMTSACSVSSWTSRASTVSSISSNVVTPPPSISSKPFIWPSNQYTACQPKIAAPKQKNVFDWITPISSSQSSPASSIFSFNDKEVEMVMDKSANLTSNSGLTPSPTPSLSDILDAVGSQPTNNNDSYFESLCSFMDEMSEAPTSTLSAPMAEETTSTSTEIGLVPPAARVAEPIPELLEPSKPVRQPTKDMIEQSGSGESSSEHTTSSNLTPKRAATRQNIKVPSKKPSVRSKRPRTCGAGKTEFNRGASISKGSATPLTPSPQLCVQQPVVAFDINDEGKHVFTIHPVTPTPSATPKPRSSAKKVKATPNAVRPSKANKSPKAATVKPVTPKMNNKKKESFSVQSLVEKFIEAAKSKKLANRKTP